jgi:hypothetical protein
VRLAGLRISSRRLRCRTLLLWNWKEGVSWLVVDEMGREGGDAWGWDGERHTARNICGGDLDPGDLSVGDHFVGEVLLGWFW